MMATARKLLKWAMPYGLVVLLQRRRGHWWRPAGPSGLSSARFAANASLRNREAGRRCFIVCTGPSINRQDLRRLAGELVITASNAYLHPHFDLFTPRYHCVPQITYGKMTPEDVVCWFADMDAKLGTADMVMADTERNLVASAGLFACRSVHYLDFENRAPDPDLAELPDLATSVPGPQSVPVMALMLALYLGCKEIYLLGVEHDHFLTGTYTYFFEVSPVSGKDPSVDADGRVVTSRYDDFHTLNLLWRQYRWLRNCAAAVGATIYNATDGGALDEFARIDFAALELAGDNHHGQWQPSAAASR